MSKLFFGLILAVVPAAAAEYAVLSSGVRVRAERHEREGPIVRLYLKDGVTELPAALITSFEEAPSPSPSPDSPVVQPEAPKPAPQTTDARTLVRDAAVRSGLPPAFVESVARVESAMRLDAVSPKGAIGVMQLMPATAKALSADPRNPEQNIDAGARLLRELLIKYDGDVVKALAAYNAGAGAVDHYGGLPPFPETVNYVGKVIRNYQQAAGP